MSAMSAQTSSSHLLLDTLLALSQALFYSIGQTEHKILRLVLNHVTWDPESKHWTLLHTSAAQAPAHTD